MGLTWLKFNVTYMPSAILIEATRKNHEDFIIAFLHKCSSVCLLLNIHLITSSMFSSRNPCKQKLGFCCFLGQGEAESDICWSIAVRLILAYYYSYYLIFCYEMFQFICEIKARSWIQQMFIALLVCWTLLQVLWIQKWNIGSLTFVQLPV